MLGTFVLSVASAAPLNMMGTVQPEGTVGVVSWMYGSQDGWVSPAVFAGAGFEHWDLWGAVGIEGAGDEPYDVILQASPRFFPVDSLGFGPRVSYTVGRPGATVGLDAVHAVYGGPFGLTTNVSVQAAVTDGGVGQGALAALVGPEVYVLPFLSVVGEVDAIVPLGDPSAVQVAVTPALSFLFDPAATEVATVGVVIPVYPEVAPPEAWTLGGYVSVTVGTRPKADAT